MYSMARHTTWAIRAVRQGGGAATVVHCSSHRPPAVPPLRCVCEARRDQRVAGSSRTGEQGQLPCHGAHAWCACACAALSWCARVVRMRMRPHGVRVVRGHPRTKAQPAPTSTSEGWGGRVNTVVGATQRANALERFGAVGSRRALYRGAPVHSLRTTQKQGGALRCCLFGCAAAAAAAVERDTV